MLIAQKNHADSGKNYFRQTQQVFPFANVLVPHSQAGSVPEGTPGGHPTAALGCCTLGCTGCVVALPPGSGGGLGASPFSL